MSNAAVLSSNLIALLEGGNAHDRLEARLRSFPLEKINLRIPGVLTPNGAPITAWQLLEHMRIAQRDIHDFTRNADYRERAFPREYWPDAADASGEADASRWRQTLDLFLEDLRALIDLARTSGDLTAELPHAAGYTVLRELLLAADHNSYHLGQIGLLEDL
jgi:hypothetical protein